MVEINNTSTQKINLKLTERIVGEFLRIYKKSAWEVSVAVVGAKRMRKLNDDYRGIDKVTDVLSFSGDVANSAGSGNDQANKYLGEVIINIEETKKASKYLEVLGKKKNADYIFCFLLVHGLLHLVGYNDEKEIERQEMVRRGTKFLSKYF